MKPLDNITIEKSCSPMSELYCIDLYFNDTESYQKFSLQYSYLINKLFDGSNATTVVDTTILHIHIEYDTLDELTFETFRPFDRVKNRSYERLAFDLSNRADRLTLALNHDIEKMTLFSLQINIRCGSKGLYQYNYIPAYKHRVENSLTCEIPTTANSISIQSSTITANKDQSSKSETSTKNSRYKFIFMFSLIGCGILLPCLLIACCLFILCKLNKQQNVIEYEPRASITSSTTDSISSDGTLS